MLLAKYVPGNVMNFHLPRIPGDISDGIPGNSFHFQFLVIVPWEDVKLLQCLVLEMLEVEALCKVYHTSY